MSRGIQAAVRVRRATFDDHAAVAALETSGGLKARAKADWQRLWMGNPAYRERAEDWPIGWVLETNEGRIVGAIGNVPLDYEFRGRRLLVAAGRAWTVDGAYRSYALLLMDQYFDQPGVDVFLNTTVNAQAAQAFSVFGSRPVPAGNWSEAAFLVTRYVGFAESALRFKEWPMAKVLRYPAGVALWAKDRLQGAGRTAAQHAVEIAAGFDERFDDFWEQRRAANAALTGVRSRASLEWHFGGDVRILTASTGGELRAYAVLQRKDEPRFGLRRMRLVDFQAPDSHREYGQAILHRAVRECRALGIHTLEQVGTGLTATDWFESRAPYRRKLPHWSYYYFAPDAGLAEELARAEAWAPSSFDGDASL